MTKKNALKKIKGREDPTMNYTECNKKKKTCCPFKSVVIWESKFRPY